MTQRTVLCQTEVDLCAEAKLYRIGLEGCKKIRSLGFCQLRDGDHKGPKIEYHKGW